MAKKKHRDKGRGKKTGKSSERRHVGVLDITRSGMGYAIVEGMQKDVLIRPADFNKAFHGDRVSIEIASGNDRTGRLQGRVHEVLERRQRDFMGRIEVTRDFAFFMPDGSRPLPDFYVHVSDLNGANDGDRVVVRFIDWKDGERNPKGSVVSVLDPTRANDLAMWEILAESGFPLSFDDETVEESERIPEAILPEEVEQRRDMRDILTFTIDPVDAKDFDDAISIREVGKGVYEIGVHIADVSHYVQPETALDRTAYERATSVYLPDRVLPMLPERLSNELCSLRPHEDKLTYSCVFTMTSKGVVKESWIGRTVIHSNHRFTYEDVQQVIDRGDGHYAVEILLLNDLAQRMRKERFRKGAINFSSQEVRFRLDADGKPLGIMVKENLPSHQLIEEFMLLANRTVATYVSGQSAEKKPVPFPFRVHDQPDEAKLLPFMDFARKFGHQFDTATPDSIAQSFNRMLQAVKGLPEQHVLEQLGIRTMAKASYTTQNIGHYGLGFSHYCHFTSPIRRYPDVLAHRVLTELLSGKTQPQARMEKTCKHCSERERGAMEAERAANKYKQVEFMSQFLGDDFDAVISGVSGVGFWAETVEHKCEGLVSLLSLQEYDDFRHVEEEYRLVGRRSGRSFRMGDRVRIKVISANLSRRQLDYEWVLAPDLPEGKTDQKTGRKNKNSRKTGR
jgi:ribonuclease R